MKLSHMLLTISMFASPPTFAARPDAPPKDDNAKACIEALGIEPHEKLTIKVLAEPRRFGQPDKADVIFSDEAKGRRRVLRLATLDFSSLRRLDSGMWTLVSDTEIETRTLTAAQHEIFVAAREEIGNVTIRIGSHSVSPTRFTGKNKLVVGDVVLDGDDVLLVLTEHPTSRYENEEGNVAGHRYQALRLEGLPQAGTTIGKQRPTAFTIEEFSYSGETEVPALLGHAEFEGEYSNVGAVRFGATIKSFTPRAAEPKNLFQVWISHYRGKYEKRRSGSSL